MNHYGQTSINLPGSNVPQGELCELCAGKDDEDLYIIFNVLYRVIVGDPFSQNSETLPEELDLSSLGINLNDQSQEDFRASQQKLQLFRTKVSSQALMELITSPRFDLLLREIFKSKYNRVQDTNCKHQELAMNFIRNFNLMSDENFENSDVQQKKMTENAENLDTLYNKVKQLKSEIESYHSEIDNLPDRIIKKLLPNHSQFYNKKSNIIDEDRDSSDEQSNEDADDASNYEVLKKHIHTNDNNSGTASTAVSSGSSSGSDSNYDKSMDNTEKQDRRLKKSKAATFKSKLPKKATDVLKNWFLNNIQNPYPSHEAKEQLSKMTGLTRKQIQNWFTNSRKRFLEPLKKKIEEQKGHGGTIPLEFGNGIFSPESHSQIDQPEPSIQSLSQDLSSFQQSQPTQQTQLTPQKAKPSNSMAPCFQNMNTNVPSKQVGFQRSQTLISPQNQSVICPGQLQTPGLQTAGLQPGGNFVVLPWVLPQPVYAYRPQAYPNILPMATPQFMPFQQNNYPGNFSMMDNTQFINNTPLMNNPYIISMQPNIIDMNGVMKQQVPVNYNALSPAICGNMNQMGSAGQPMYLNQTKPLYLDKMAQFGSQTNVNADKVIFNNFPDGLQKHHYPVMSQLKTDFNEPNYQEAKYLHKNQYPETNLI